MEDLGQSVGVQLPPTNPAGTSTKWKSVQSFPSEILGEIFLRALELGSSRRPLLRVCRHWREVVLSSPELWSRISIELNLSAEHDLDTLLRLWKTRFARSGVVLLDLEVQVKTEPFATDSRSPDWLVPLVSGLRDDLNRCKSFSILSAYTPQIDFDWASFIHVLRGAQSDWQSLQSFTVDVVRPWNANPITLDSLDPLGALRHLTWAQPAPLLLNVISLLPSSLRSVELGSIANKGLAGSLFPSRDVECYEHDVLRLMLHAPLLEHCSVVLKGRDDVPYLERQSDPHFPKVTLAELKTLRIDHKGESLWHFFDSLIVPCLESLDVKCVNQYDSRPIRALNEFHIRSGFHLRSLALTAVPSFEGIENYGILTQPSLHLLDIQTPNRHGCVFPSFVHLLKDNVVNGATGNLQSLSLTIEKSTAHTLGDHERPLLDLLASLIELRNSNSTNSGIRSLVIHFNMYDEWRQGTPVPPNSVGPHPSVIQLLMDLREVGLNVEWDVHSLASLFSEKKSREFTPFDWGLKLDR